MWSPSGILNGSELRDAYLECLAIDKSSCALVGILRLEKRLRPERVISAFYRYVGIDAIIPLKEMDNCAPNALHHALVSLLIRKSISSIVTTNFDSCFEKAVIMESGVTERIVKIHGSAKNLRSMRIRLEQVLSPLQRRLRNLLKQLTEGRDLIVLGYSCYDNDIWPVLQSLRLDRLLWVVDPRESSTEEQTPGNSVVPIFDPRNTVLKAQKGMLLTYDLRSLPQAMCERLDLTIADEAIRQMHARRATITQTVLVEELQRRTKSLPEGVKYLILGELLSEVNRPTDARIAFRMVEHRAIQEDIRISATHQIAAIYSRFRKVSIAQRCYSRYASLKYSELTAHSLGLLLCGYAEFLRKRFRTKESLRISKRALTLGVKTEDREVRGRAILSAANTLSDDLKKHDWREIDMMYSEAIALLRKPRLVGWYAQALNDRAGLFYTANRFKRAATHYRKSMLAFLSIGDLYGASTAELNLGMCYADLRQSDDAISVLSRLIESREFQRNPDLLSFAYSNRAWAYMTRSQFKDSLLDSKRAIRFADTESSRVHETIQMADALIGLGQIRRASHCLKRLAPRKIDRHNRGHYYKSLSIIHFQRQDEKGAMDLIQKARDCFSHVEDEQGLKDCDLIANSHGKISEFA
jgi:tetratricopeptide (TPR) repeat protein